MKQRLALANDAKTCKSMGCKNNGGKRRMEEDLGVGEMVTKQAEAR